MAQTQPRLIAHRGASHAAPENTLAAMRLAWKEGADGIEGDFQLTSDGEIVCIHDTDTLRLTGTRLVIKDTTWDALARLDVGKWKSPAFTGERMPRFAEMLDLLPPGKFFFVEVKSGPNTIAAIKTVLDSRKGKFDPAKVVIISFTPEVVKEARRLLPEHEAHLVSSMAEYGQPGYEDSLVRMISNCGANGLQFSYRTTITPEWMQRMKTRALKLTSWTINDPSHAADIISKGIHFITTDRPGPLRDELIRRGALLSNYAVWSNSHMTSAINHDPLADDDADGLQNFAELALGIEPMISDSGQALHARCEGVGDEKSFTVSYLRLMEQDPHYQYQLEYSSDLKNWHLSTTATEFTDTHAPDSYERVTVTEPIVRNADALFARVRVIYIP